MQLLEGQFVVGGARKPANKTRGGGMSGRATSDFQWNVAGVACQDEQGLSLMIDDARVVEVMRARASLVRDGRARRQKRGQTGVELLPRQYVKPKLNELLRAPKSSGSAGAARARQNQIKQTTLIVGARHGAGLNALHKILWRQAVPVYGGAQAEMAAIAIDLVQSDHVRDRAGAGIVADDDHHHQGVAKANRETGQKVLEAAGGVVLVALLHGHGLLKLECAVVNCLKRCHQDGDFARAGRGDNLITAAVGLFAGPQVFEVPVGLELPGLT